jgi:aminoglycoside phosphotransferase family enzyme/predicted kinase
VIALEGLPANLASLLAPEAYPHPVEHVRLLETHMSWVLLAGAFAYKIKRPVRYPFVDMRTVEQRQCFCREELRLNRRFAPELYLQIVAITSDDDGKVQIGGAGAPIEYAVQMRQFDTRQELACLLAQGQVEPHELASLGEDLARIHDRFPPIATGERYGSLVSVKATLRDNLTQLAALSRRAGFEVNSQPLELRMHERLDETGALIEARRAGGRVRECHGDLHCRNVVRSSGRLVAFDGLEFEPAFRWIDVAEEIAFLFMDLCRRDGAVHANAFVNAYLRESGDYEAVRLLRLYGAHRALVRAKVAALDGTGKDERGQHASDHRAYVECAENLLAPQRPLLILTSGLSGSGKTWLAQRLAGRIGAIHVRSDIERKRLAGLAPQGASHSGIDQGLYAHETNDRTYARLARCSSDILAGGFCAIADATFQRRADRALFRTLSADRGVPMILIRCRAPVEVLRARVLDRAKKGNDPSEADLAVLERQQTIFEEADPGETLDVIEADTTRATVVDEIEHALKLRARP